MNNEVLRAIADTLDGVLQAHCESLDKNSTEIHNWNEPLWAALDEIGVFLASLPEQAGGLDFGLSELSFGSSGDRVGGFEGS